MNITIIGCGRLGVPYAVGLARDGHHVLGLDTNAVIVEQLQAGITFGEPGLAEAVREQAAAGRLSFTTSYDEAAAHARLHFITVATPQRDDSFAADLTDLRTAFVHLSSRLRQDSVIIGKSSVPVGTTRALAELVARITRPGVDVRIGFSPDFLRESTSLADVMRPSRIILGVPDGDRRVEEAARQAWGPLARRGVPLLVTTWSTAELAKEAANAFLATKTSYANVLAELCHAAGADVEALTVSLGLDPRIGPSGLVPGLGYGGSCLSKDIRAFITRAGELGLGDMVRMFREVDAVNAGRRIRYTDLAAEIVGGLPGAKIAVWGASFKPGVDDIRDSPALEVAARLHRAGAQVTIYDPAATELALREHPEIPHADTAEAALAGADLLMVLTDWEQFRQADPARLRDLPAHPRVIDARICLDPGAWRTAGWQYVAIGRQQ